MISAFKLKQSERLGRGEVVFDLRQVTLLTLYDDQSGQAVIGQHALPIIAAEYKWLASYVAPNPLEMNP